jgi:hypothetical protein
MRTAAFGWVELLATRAFPALAEHGGWNQDDLHAAMTPYWAEYDHIVIDAEARAATQFDLAEEPERWVVTQRLIDPAGDGEWHFVATVDLAQAQARADGAPNLQLETLGRLTGRSRGGFWSGPTVGRSALAQVEVSGV